jgi:hypothetical protein
MKFLSYREGSMDKLENKVLIEQCSFCKCGITNIFHTHAILDSKKVILCPEHFEIYKGELLNNSK